MRKRSVGASRTIPTQPYDLVAEGLIVFGFWLIVIIVLAVVFGSPDYPTVRSEDVAVRQPDAFLKTSAGILAGKSGIQGYGPPYTPDPGNAQEIAGISPARWFGVTIPIDPPKDFVLRPLTRAAALDPRLDGALKEYDAATPEARKAWVDAYLSALDRMTVVDGGVNVPPDGSGPVHVMMDGMLRLAGAGLLEGAIESDARLPYTLDFTKSFLFFQDDVDGSVAEKLDMLGEQWGISHETGPYPGAWWLWPYTFLYQVPPMSESPNGDLQVVVIMAVFYLLMLFVPFIPIVNRIPYWVPVYRIVWRDWYRRQGKE